MTDQRIKELEEENKRLITLEPHYYREAERLHYAEKHIKELEAQVLAMSGALKAISEAPGGGPGKRIAIQALSAPIKQIMEKQEAMENLYKVCHGLYPQPTSIKEALKALGSQ